MPMASLAAAVLLALTGCAQKVDTPLPDLRTKDAGGTGQKTMTPAEQKKAIDEMIARRDGKDKASAASTVSK